MFSCEHSQPEDGAIAPTVQPVVMKSKWKLRRRLTSTLHHQCDFHSLCVYRSTCSLTQNSHIISTRLRTFVILTEVFICLYSKYLNMFQAQQSTFHWAHVHSRLTAVKHPVSFTVKKVIINFISQHSEVLYWKNKYRVDEVSFKIQHYVDTEHDGHMW